MSNSKPVTTLAIQRKKNRGEPLVMVTAYDATFAKLAEEASADLILIGDSLGNVIQGHETTLPVTLDEMIYHTRCVARGAQRPLLVGDLPFGSYQSSVELGMRSAERLMKEGHAHAVKLEGGAHHADLVHRLTLNGVPVMGHLGLTPQSVHTLGGYRVQGKEEAAAEKLIADAKVLEQAGAFALVLECVTAPIAARITESLRIPTIGIGSGNGCDGQVLVIYDLLGLTDGFTPKFVKQYAQLGGVVRESIATYAQEVRGASFPR